MRKRLRDMPSDEELARLYAIPHDHMHWADHRVRVDMIVALARHFTNTHGTVLDLSCGNGAIARGLTDGDVILGDFAPGYEFVGPIANTVGEFAKTYGQCDTFVCCETIEHLDNPTEILSLIRPVATQLVLSTPVSAHDDTNAEHLWSWDMEDVDDMLLSAGWSPTAMAILALRPAGFVYNYLIGVWS
jgi:hypothetical protein